MSWSLGEIRILAKKATRGAGLSWGLAEDAGFAVHWLEARSAPGLQALAAYLTWRDSPQDRLTPIWRKDEADESTIFCPIEMGAAIIDAKIIPRGRLGCLPQPLLLAPFLTMVGAGSSLSLSFADVNLLVSANDLQVAGNDTGLLSEPGFCNLSDAEVEIPAGQRNARVSGSAAPYMAVLDQFAARTYAPSTEESRLTGAGAGLSDND